MPIVVIYSFTFKETETIKIYNYYITETNKSQVKN